MGIAKKNENSAATPLETPSNKAPIIVAPDLEVPGIIAKHWKNPIKKPADKGIVIDEESEEYRASKLPDEEAIFIIADIFSRKDSELSNRDVFVSSAVGLLLSAPERASELFFLKVNCIDKEDKKARL